MRRLIVLTLLTLTALAGCSGPDATDDAASPTGPDTAGPDDGVADAPGDEVAEAAADADLDAPEPDVGERDAAGAGETAGQHAVRPASSMAGRRVIRTARIELAAKDPDRTVDDVYRVAERAGGFVATTDLRRDDEDLLRGTVTLRVPSDDLVEVLHELEELAVSAPVSRIDERDVTTEASDLEARLTNLTTYEDELRALLADVREDTSSPDDLLRIFERIREVREEIDTIEGRLASLSEQVALATVDVRIDAARAALPVADPTWAPSDTVREAFTAAARGLGRIADAAIWLAVGVLPVLLVVAVPAGGVALLWHRLRRRRGGTSTTPPPTPQAPPATTDPAT